MHPVWGRTLHVRIGQLEIDESKREIHTPHGRLAPQPKVFDMLVYLVRERDRVVSRDELLRTIWRDTAVGPDSITRALREVRRLVGDRDLVRTFPSRGVRFVGAVVDLASPADVLDPIAELDGRGSAIAAIDAVLARMPGRRGGLRIVIGPPGTGKSALLAAAEQRGIASGYAVVRATSATLGHVVGDAAATRQPTLVVLDDLHREPNVDSDGLATRTANVPVVVVAACCASRRRDPRVAAMLAAATRDDPDAIVSIGALDRDALTRLATRMLERNVSPAGITKLDALTGGNPRFARHVLHLAKQADRPLETLDALPPSFADRLRELVLEHVGVVGPEARLLLDALSILDQPFTLELAAEVAGTSPARTADVLREVAEVGLVTDATPGWRFAHELVRSVVEQALAPSRRATYHARAAAAIERLLGAPPSQLDRIARHYSAGYTVAPTSRAFDALRRACELALEGHRFGAAADWLATALEIEARLEPASPARRRSLWLEYGKALSRDGQVERAAEAFATAESYAEDARREGEAVRTAFRAIASSLPLIVDRVYELLFERHPQLRQMFTRSPPLQRRMFGEAIAALADHADDPDWLRRRLDVLGRRHAEYGVTDEMYDWARTAFLDAMTSTLAPRQLSSDVVETWQRTLAAIAETMIAAGRVQRITLAPHAFAPTESPRASTR